MINSFKKLKAMLFFNKSILTLIYFDKAKETSYRKSVADTKNLHYRYAPLITTFFYISFSIFDFSVATSEQFNSAFFFHISMVFILILPSFLTLFKKLESYMFYSLAIAPIYAVIGNTFLLYLGMDIYTHDIFLIVTWVFIMAGFLFYQATFINIILMIITIVTFLIFDIFPLIEMLIHFLYLFITFAIGMFALYIIEYSSRSNFEDKNKIEIQNKIIKDSIQYASLIQQAILPSTDIKDTYFKDSFICWQPKDIVGGDIYLFEELRETKDECLFMVIDCTGHGIPGAFVTMLVKAIERQVISKIQNDCSIDVSPAWILSYFNKNMKKLLKQEDKDSISNVGFDGGVIYYNKKTQVLKFAGAETPLFYIEDGELKTIKGNRQSVGYKRSDMNYKFKEHIMKVKVGMKFYLTTDGYLDQNGGEKGFPFGKKRFTNILTQINNKVFSDQKEILLNTLSDFQADEERNDDISVIGFEI